MSLLIGLLAVACLHRVPATPPDTVPGIYYEEANLVYTTRLMTGPYPRNIVAVQFRREATVEERQAAIDLIGGCVVGGYGLSGEYLVRVPEDGTGEAPVVGAVERLQTLPQVTQAGPDLVLPSSLAAQSVCPGENEEARGAVVKFLTLESTLPTRQADGLAGVSHLRLRLLTDATDSAVCRTLRDGIRLRRSPTPWQWAFYYADGFYFVATVRDNPPGMIMLGHNPLIVLRSDLSLVDNYAN